MTKPGVARCLPAILLVSIGIEKNIGDLIYLIRVLTQFHSERHKVLAILSAIGF